MRSTRGLRWGSLCVLTAVAGAGSTARAQSGPPYDPAVDVQLFEYATGPNSFLTVTGADILAKSQYAVSFFVTFMTKPFTVYNVDETDETITGERTNVVESVFAGEIGGAYGLSDKYQVGVSLPLVFSISGDGLNPPDAMPTADGLQATGFGDLRAELKLKLWEQGGLRLAVVPGVTIPTSVGAGGSAFLGDNLPSARGRVALHWSDPAGNFELAANAGVLFRKPRTIYASDVGQQLTYGAAAKIRVTSRVDLIGELFGRAGFDFDADSSPIEADGAIKLAAAQAISVMAGGGAGLDHGIGSPALRVFLTVGWSPDTRDSDGDGVPNNRDRCIDVPEDLDGFQDSDGCPDPDNDNDRRLDSEDKCPNDPEDLDGFDDDDGCPDLDNDKDGLADADDRCPNYPEDGKPPYPKDGCPADRRDSDDDGVMDAADKCPDEQEDQDGFEDFDGCPDADNDGDFIPDEFDKCPLCPEDNDQFADDDGCPELDNDADGLVDARDKCPNEAETINGINDFDGCPDEGGSQDVSVDGDQMTLAQKVSFTPTGTIGRRSLGLVDQIAATMLLHSEVSMWRVVVSAAPQKTEDKTRAMSSKQADAIKAYLVRRGVPAEHLEVMGAVGEQATVAIVIRERTEQAADAAPVCPPGSEVTGRAAPAPGGAQEADADDDGYPDSTDKCPNEAETWNGFTDEDGCPDELPRAIRRFTGVIRGINFKTNSDLILRSSFRILDQAAALLAQYPELRVEISGHTDDQGDHDYNVGLSQRRAEAVRAYLIDKGIAEARLKSLGFGPDKPIADNKRNAGRAKNRRVEFRLITAHDQ